MVNADVLLFSQKRYIKTSNVPVILLKKAGSIAFIIILSLIIFSSSEQAYFMYIIIFFDVKLDRRIGFSYDISCIVTQPNK